MSQASGFQYQWWECPQFVLGLWPGLGANKENSSLESPKEPPCPCSHETTQSLEIEWPSSVPKPGQYII